MNLTSETLEQAVQAGLAITDPKQDLLQVYREHTVGITILRMLCGSILAGEIVLSSTAPPAGAQLPDGVVPPMTGDVGGLDDDDLKAGGTSSDDD